MWPAWEDHITTDFLKAVFYKFYLVHYRIPWPIYYSLTLNSPTWFSILFLKPYFKILVNNPFGKKIRQEVMIIKSKFLHDLKTKSRQVKPHGIYLTRKCFCQKLFSLPHKNPLLALMLNLQLWEPDTDKKSFCWKIQKSYWKKKLKAKPFFMWNSSDVSLE